ncbi:MAG: hypothetical protein ACXU8U_03935, partial [Asticcacaulis sp.]
MIYSEAESRVIVAAREGSIAYFHNDEPVRADLIRRLMLGLEMEDGQRVPAPCGIQIVGAVIHGQLDISNGRGAHGNTLPGLMLDACQIADGIDISFAQMGKLSLEKSAVSALWAVRSVIRGELIANDIRPATAGPCYLRLHGLHVDGDVQVRRAELQEPEGDDEFGSRQFALDLRNAVVMGNVYVRETVCNGTINISLARIGGIFTASGASITPLIAGGDAIQADGVSIGGALSLRRAISGKPMQANGRISFARSRLGATILDGAHINGVSRIAWGLDFEESAIDGALFLRDGFTTDG